MHHKLCFLFHCHCWSKRSVVQSWVKPELRFLQTLERWFKLNPGLPLTQLWTTYPPKVFKLYINLTACMQTTDKRTGLYCLKPAQYRKTVDMCQRAEQAGASWITVHGRTIEQRSEPCSLETIKLVRRISVYNNPDLLASFVLVFSVLPFS